VDNLTTYSHAQLALRNGQDKPEVWVAYLGLIYDVTHSTLWKSGKHYEHWASQDLTDELPRSALTPGRYLKNLNQLVFWQTKA